MVQLSILGRVVAALTLIFFFGSAAPGFPQAPAKVPAIKRQAAPPTPAIAGDQMYHAYCAACHGVRGRGDGPAAPALKKVPSDLTVLSKNNNGKFPYASFHEAVEGAGSIPAHGTADMPVWGSIFRAMPGHEELRITNLAKFVELLQVK